MKPDQERVKNLLCDTVTLLCKNGLTFGEELRVEGLIGITLDSSEVFLVNINERFSASSDRQNETLPSLDLPGLLSSHSDEKMTVKNQGKLGRTSNQNSNTHKRNDSVMEPSKVNDSQSLSVQQSSNVLASGKAAVKLEADDDVVIVEGTGTQIAKEENNSSNMKGKDNLQIQHPQQNSDTYGSVDFSSLEDEHEFSDSLLGADHPKQGEPPSKRRTLENINPVASESQYVPGLVKNEQATEAEISSNQWQNISATPVSSMPGCSDWSVDTSKDTTMQQGDSEPVRRKAKKTVGFARKRSVVAFPHNVPPTHNMMFHSYRRKKRYSLHPYAVAEGSTVVSHEIPQPVAPSPSATPNALTPELRGKVIAMIELGVTYRNIQKDLKTQHGVSVSLGTLSNIKWRHVDNK